MPREDATNGRCWATILVESQRRRLLLWRRPDALQRASVEIRPYPCWESPECLWRLRVAEHPLQPPARWRIFRRRIPRAHQVITLGEEEISDVSLSTFYVFDKENAATTKVGESRLGLRRLRWLPVRRLPLRLERLRRLRRLRRLLLVLGTLPRLLDAQHFPTQSIDTGRHGRVLLDPAGPVLFAVRPCASRTRTGEDGRADIGTLASTSAGARAGQRRSRNPTNICPAMAIHTGGKKPQRAHVRPRDRAIAATALRNSTAKTFRSSRRISPSMCCRPMSCASIPRTGSFFSTASSIARSRTQSAPERASGRSCASWGRNIRPTRSTKPSSG